MAILNSIARSAERGVLGAGLIPLLGAPMGGSNSEAMLAEAVGVAVRRGLVRANQHVVCVLSVRGDFMLKAVSVDDVGAGLSKSISSAGARSQTPHIPSLRYIVDTTAKPQLGHLARSHLCDQ